MKASGVEFDVKKVGREVEEKMKRYVCGELLNLWICCIFRCRCSSFVEGLDVDGITELLYACSVSNLRLKGLRLRAEGN